MSDDSDLTLTASERVLIHLKGYWQHHNSREFPPAITQKGISDMAGIRLSHVPRTLKRLLENNLISEEKGHVAGERRRYKVYFLTEAGLEETKRFLNTIQDRTVEGMDGTVKDIIDSGGLRALLSGADTPVPGEAVTKVIGNIPNTKGFVNRAAELESLERWLDDTESKVMVIYGSHGFGGSTLAAKFIQAKKGWCVCWLKVEKEMVAMNALMAANLRELFGPDFQHPKDAGSLVSELAGKHCIIVFDGYFDVSDEAVEFFSSLVSEVKDTEGIKFLFTAREDTPSYNRFYTILDLNDGTVGEIHLRGLDPEDCRVILGTPDIAPDALRRLYLFTRGCPTTLKLLASENEAEMRARTRFTPEEIKLMLFLKGQRE